MSGEELGQLGYMSPSSEDGKALFTAVSHGKVHRLSTLLARADDLNVRDASNRTPLIAAIFLQRDDVRSHVMRMLIRHGCDVNAEDSEGRTALMYACMEDDKVDSVRLLIRCKQSDPNIQDRDGYTALMHAAVSGNTAAIRVLVSHANTKNVLDVNAVSKQGLSALELAMKLRLKEVCKLLVHEGCADKVVKDRTTLFDILKGDGSRTNTPFAYQNMNSPRHVFSPRMNVPPVYGVRTSPFSRQNSDLYRRIVLSPQAEVTSPLPRKFPSDVYNRLLNSPNLQFPVSPREMDTPGLPQYDLMNKQSSRRPLTPITPRNVVIKTKSPSPVNTLTPNNRLPSIPSGRRARKLESPSKLT